MFKKILHILIAPILLCTIVSCNEKLDQINRKTFERWGEYCVTTPNNKLGQCVQFTKCDYLNVVQNNLQFAKENICGTASYTPLVCCPLSNEDVAPHTSLETTKCFNSPISNQIMGGTAASYDSSPWIALLSFDDTTIVNKTYTCGGSLINDRYVLTAAHCLKGPDDDRQIASVHLGEWDFTFDNYTNGLTRPFDVDVEKIIPHPNYQEDHRLFDIGLIRISRSVLSEYSLNMRPINLPYNIENNGLGAYSIAGFGQTDTEATSQIKQQGSIKSVSYAECREKFNARGGEIQQIQLCGTSTLNDTCFGDSGGSLAEMRLSKDLDACFYLMGIVSYGSLPCGAAILPSVYTNVLPFLEWISANIKV